MSKGSDERFTDTVQSTEDESGPDLATPPVCNRLRTPIICNSYVAQAPDPTTQSVGPKTRAVATA
jgi:hypothetical protein